MPFRKNNVKFNRDGDVKKTANSYQNNSIQRQFFYGEINMDLTKS